MTTISTPTITTTAYFDAIEKEIIERLEMAEISIFICMAWLSDKIYGDTLREISKKNIKINIIVDDNKSNKTHSIQESSEFPNIKIHNIKNTNYIMHNKFCIIDYKIVLTGSYNYSINARNHMENIVVIENNTPLVEAFIKEFYAIKNFYNFDNKPTTKNKIQCTSRKEIELKYRDLKAKVRSKNKKGTILSEIKILNKKCTEEINNRCLGATFNLAIIGPLVDSNNQTSPIQIWRVCNHCFSSTALLPDSLFYHHLTNEDHSTSDNDYHGIGIFERFEHLANHYRNIANFLSENQEYPIHALGSPTYNSYEELQETLRIFFIRKGHKHYIPEMIYTYEGNIEDVIYSVIY